MNEGRPITILLVEDDPAHAEIVRRNLADAHVANELIHLSDGQAALDYLRREGPFAGAEAPERPDLILLDLRLPKVDGLDVLEGLRRDEDLSLIPTVILTTSAAEADVSGAYERGASSYLVKPVDFEKFSTLMKTFGFYWLAWNRFPDEKGEGS